MVSRTLFVTSILSLSMLAPVGCAAPSDDDASEEAVAEATDELNAAAKPLVGKYYARTTTPRQLGRLTLRGDGTYTASVDISDVALCVTYPCLRPESGRWNAVRSGATVRLRLRPTGEPSRWYDAVKTAAGLTLTRAGKTETLYALDANACLDASDCDANEECGPKMCLMYCEVDDPYCCGPSTCQPKAPPPPSSCGHVQCAAGEVCCNPLAGICTKPGEFCAF